MVFNSCLFNPPFVWTPVDPKLMFLFLFLYQFSFSSPKSKRHDIDFLKKNWFSKCKHGIQKPVFSGQSCIHQY